MSYLQCYKLNGHLKTYILSELPFSGPVLSPDVTFTQHSNVSHEKLNIHSSSK